MGIYIYIYITVRSISNRKLFWKLLNQTQHGTKFIIFQLEYVYITIRSTCNLKHFRNLKNQTQHESRFKILKWESIYILQLGFL
jgi:hypothetical protein